VQQARDGLSPRGILTAPPDPKLESTAARLVDELLDGGEQVGEGGFTIDAAAAAAKLEAFAYADRSVFLIPIVEGLIGLGAPEVAIETAIEDLVITVRPIDLDDPADRFDNLHAHAIGDSDDPVQRAFGRIAMGLDMLLSASETTRARLQYSSDDTDVAVELRGRTVSRLNQTRLDGIRTLSLVIDVGLLDLQAVDLRAALAHLRAAVEFSTAKISLDGQLISGRTREWFEPSTGEGPGFRFSAGLEELQDAASTIELWTAGVCVERQAGEGFGFTAAIHIDRPRRDLARTKVVRDATVEQALIAIEQARQAALLQLALADASWTEATRPSSWPSARVDRVLGRQAREHPSEAHPELESRRPQSTWQLISVLGDRVPGRAALGQLLGYSLVFLGLMIVGMGLFDPKSVLQDSVWGSMAIVLGLAVNIPLHQWANRVVRIREQGSRTRARLTGWERGRSPRGLERHEFGRLLWQFEHPVGTPRTGRSRRMQSQPAQLWLAREWVIVYYDPENPDESYWEDDVGRRREY
jgi:hypothetical protein